MRRPASSDASSACPLHPRMPSAGPSTAWSPLLAEVMLIHSVLGLRPAVDEFARSLRAAGHNVHAPDLLGRTFSDYETGLEFLEKTGWECVLQRAEAVAACLVEAPVFAGFSVGAAIAQWLA